MIEIPVKDSLIYFFEFFVEFALGLRLFLKHPGRQRGHQRECHYKAGRKSVGYGESHILEKLSGKTLHEDDGRKNTYRRKGG